MWANVEFKSKIIVAAAKWGVIVILETVYVMLLLVSDLFSLSKMVPI